jgi:hypothetical protein
VLAGAGALFWANTQKDSDGYFRTGAHNFSTPSFALESDDLDIGNDAPDWLFDEGRLATIRIEARARAASRSSSASGRRDAVDAYLRGSATPLSRTSTSTRSGSPCAPQPRRPAANAARAADLLGRLRLGPDATVTWDIAEAAGSRSS